MRSAIEWSWVTMTRLVCSSSVQFEHQPEHMLPVPGIEVARRLVRKHELRSRDQRTGDSRALTLPA